MRNTEERLKEALRGAKIIKKRQRERRIRLLLGGGSLCLVLFFAIIIPDLVQMINLPTNTTDFTASIFASNSSLTYIIIGILSFVLGIVFTILCIILKKKGDKEDNDN